MPRVIFDVVRHGLKDGDSLTLDGRRQVVASAEHNLQGTVYDGAFYSGMNRAAETVFLVLDTLGQLEKITPKKEEGFGYAWAEDPRWPFAEAQKKVDELKAAGQEETADLWLQCWPTTMAIRGRFLATLLFRAYLLAREGNKDSYHVLVGSHSPTGELAALDPKTTPRLREADVIRYVVEVSGEDAKLISSEVLRAPY